jgi:hypothetical protein
VAYVAAMVPQATVAAPFLLAIIAGAAAVADAA